MQISYTFSSLKKGTSISKQNTFTHEPSPTFSPSSSTTPVKSTLGLGSRDLRRSEGVLAPSVDCWLPRGVLGGLAIAFNFFCKELRKNDFYSVNS